MRQGATNSDKELSHMQAFTILHLPSGVGASPVTPTKAGIQKRQGECTPLPSLERARTCLILSKECGHLHSLANGNNGRGT